MPSNVREGTAETRERQEGPRWAPVVVSAIAVALMCAFIFYMSARPADESDAMSMGVVWHVIGFIVPGYDQMSPDEQLQWQAALNYPVRKTAHFLEYAVLGGLVLNLLAQVKRARSRSGNAPGGPGAHGGALSPLNGVAAWALSVAYAGTDEVHQLFVDGRAGKLADVLVDGTGALFGILVAELLFWFAGRAVRRRAGGYNGANETRGLPNDDR